MSGETSTAIRPGDSSPLQATPATIHAPTDPADIPTLVAAQRAFFASGATRTAEFRLTQLARLRDAIVQREEDLFRALDQDLGKGRFESYTSEIGFLYIEIRHARRHLRRWMRPRRVPTPLVSRPGSSRVIYRPLGVSAIVAPWNYPLQLLMAPLVGAIAAGNCAVVKPSEFAPATAAVIADLVASVFPVNYITVVQGDGEVAAALTGAAVDHIFFTGSTRVGRMVAHAAAERLIPATLELGGQSPAIVARDVAASDRYAQIAARRIVWGRFMNAGQTCVAPDYACVPRDSLDDFAARVGEEIRRMYGVTPGESGDYGRIITDGHFERLVAVVERQSERAAPLIGGEMNAERRYIAPTVFGNVAWDDPIMEEETFGPILPILAYDDPAQLYATIASRAAPLAAYLFSRDRTEVARFRDSVPFGGATVNDTIVHLANPDLPFGGHGTSGIGSYHGEYGFRAFSHEGAFVKRGMRPDPALRYPPYGSALDLLRTVIRP